MAIDPDTFRNSLRRWASGVTVVTSRANGEQHGMTVSAFSSVSADPPLVLICANRTSRTHALMRDAGIFAVNVLADDQQELSGRFSSSKTENSRFEGVSHFIGLSGAPVLEGTVVSLECKTTTTIDQGTHCLYIGEVVAAHLSDKTPLLYFDGSYRSLADAR